MQLIDLKLTPVLSARGLLEFSVDDLPLLMNSISEDTDLGNKFIRMFIILQNFKMDDFAQEMQNQAFVHRNVFRFLSPPKPIVRLLMIAGPGNMGNNAPLDFVLFNQNVQLDYFYVVDEYQSWESVPDHDIAILGFGEATKHKGIHDCIEQQRVHWPRPFLNNAKGVMHCARDNLYELLKDDPELVVPCTRRVRRLDVNSLQPPFLIRPLDTHSGQGFERIQSKAALGGYLANYQAEIYYISEYIDCSSSDGLFRKFRIALIDKKPYICHLAISDDWVVHYIAAHMEHSLEKRQEEEKFIREFDSIFVAQYGACLDRIAHKIELDYVVLDCAISKVGRLVLFEADNGAWIHDTDAPDIYPYKSEIMNRAFSGFTQLLLDQLTLTDNSTQIRDG